jgi:hypothetical protein
MSDVVDISGSTSEDSLTAELDGAEVTLTLRSNGVEIGVRGTRLTAPMVFDEMCERFSGTAGYAAARETVKQKSLDVKELSQRIARSRAIAAAKAR